MVVNGYQKNMTNYFYRDWKPVPVKDVPEIPKDLLNYDHTSLLVGTHNGPEGWKVVLNESNQDFEACSATMFPLSGFILSAVIGILFTAVILGLNEFGNISLFNSLLIGSIGVAVVLGIPAAYAFCVWLDMKYWGGPLRMRFTAINKEFFFPRENKTYSQGDYEKIVLGCVGGFNITAEMFEFMGMIARKNSGRSPAQPMNIQYFILVLTVGGNWHRHYIANNAPYLFTKSGSARFDKLVELLQPQVDCLVYNRRFSMMECYRIQLEEKQENGRSEEVT